MEFYGVLNKAAATSPQIGRRTSQSSKNRSGLPKNSAEPLGFCRKALQNVSRSKKPVEEPHRFCPRPANSSSIHQDQGVRVHKQGDADARKSYMSRMPFLHPQRSGHPYKISGTSQVPSPRKTNFRGRERTLRPYAFRVEDPTSHPAISKKLIFVFLFLP